MPKCSKCGFRARDIAGLAKHYHKKHPGSMKRKRSRSKKPKGEVSYSAGFKYCPCCGREM